MVWVCAWSELNGASVSAFMDIFCVTQCVGAILVDFSSFSIPKFLSERSALCVAL